MIVVVRPEEAARNWFLFEPMFKRATDTTNGCWEPIDILRGVLNGEQIMWAAHDPATDKIEAVITTRIQNHPRRRVLDVMFVAGDRMDKWIAELVEVIEKYAREKGCTGGSGAFRRGWVKAWPGAVEHGVNLFKDLTQ